MSEKKKPKKHPPSSNDFEPANDGVDHINVYSRGKTKLGKLMSNFAHTPFTYHGKTYQSIEGALYYYRTEDDRLIAMHGSQAKKLGSSLKEKQIETPAMIKSWIYAKLFANPEIIDLLLQNNLPYAHYYIMYGRKIPAGISLPEIWREVTDELNRIYKTKKTRK
ncbi:MAG TPA: hypothetical protein PL089_14515 [Ignavibacteria bacterium]|nr:hypothetical protein [Ignavibacteria bacterium]